MRQKFNKREKCFFYWFLLVVLAFAALQYAIDMYVNKSLDEPLDLDFKQIAVTLYYSQIGILFAGMVVIGSWLVCVVRKNMRFEYLYHRN